MTTVEHLERALADAEAELESARQAAFGQSDEATARLRPDALRQHQARTDAQMARYTRATDRAQEARQRLAAAKYRRPPKTAPVMPTVKVGDRIRPVLGHNLLTVVKVNRKSIVTEGGVRWAVGEFEVTA